MIPQAYHRDSAGRFGLGLLGAPTVLAQTPFGTPILHRWRNLGRIPMAFG